MASAKGKIARILGGLVLRRARVVEAGDVAPGFRKLVLQGDVPAPAPGAKLQVLLPSDDMRTYTPIASADRIALLGWKHAGGPGTRWLSAVGAGDEIRFVGPQRSLSLGPGPVIMVGDETSVGVAASFAAERPARVQAILQVNSPDAARDAAEAVGLRPAHVAARGDTTSVVDAVIAAQATAPDAVVALTGGSELVLAVRRALRDRGARAIKTKTYWIPGRAGLD